MAELSWWVSAMNDATERLRKASGRDLPEGLALASESVWWINLVEATVMRTSQAAYDQALTNLDPAERRATEGTFAGLRFVRNWLGYHADPADFIQPGQNEEGGEVPVTAWTWTFLAAPELGERSPRNRQADAVRYRQCCKYLASKPISETITCAVAFLNGVAPGLFVGRWRNLAR
jgi:hypothetical protein